MLSGVAIRSGSVGRGALAALLAAVASLLVVADHVEAQCQYEVTIIQAPECPIFGFPPTFGLGLSEQGHVVGYHFDCEFIDDEAFVWTPETGLVTLPFPAGTIRKRAFDIEGSLIVGRFDVLGDGLGDLAFLYDGQELIVIPPPAGGTFSDAAAVNQQRQIAGTTSDSNTFHAKAFFWQDGIMTLIQPTFGSSSIGYDINDANSEIVGWMGRSGSDYHAFLRQSGKVLDLGVIPGGFTAQAAALSNLPDVVGWGQVPDPKGAGNATHAFRWHSGDMIDLGTLPGFRRSFAQGVNDCRTVIGFCRDFGGSINIERGFVWQDGVMTDLNDLIAPDLGLVIKRAEAINNEGQIITRATLNGKVVAALVTPIAPRLGDLDRDCAVGISDLLILLSNWGTCPPRGGCPADLDGDGAVGILDLLTLLANWSSP